jgi:hypothetical protein
MTACAIWSRKNYEHFTFAEMVCKTRHTSDKNLSSCHSQKSWVILLMNIQGLETSVFLNIGVISENLDIKWSGTLISTCNAPSLSSMTACAQRCELTRNKTVNPVNGKLLSDAQRQSDERTRYLLNRGYQLKVMRECEWKKAIKENQDLKQFVNSMTRPSSIWNMVLVSLQKPSTGSCQSFPPCCFHDVVRKNLTVWLPILTIGWPLFQDLPNYFTIPDKRNNDLHRLLKENIVGGPSIVLHRYHERNVTTIRPAEYDDTIQCKKIISFDANAFPWINCLVMGQLTALIAK